MNVAVGFIPRNRSLPTPVAERRLRLMVAVSVVATRRNVTFVLSVDWRSTATLRKSLRDCKKPGCASASTNFPLTQLNFRRFYNIITFVC
jgi:hypothetical protein